jgi:hypothetical protein
MTRQNVWGSQEEKERVVDSLGFSGRYCLQVLGTEIFRTEDPTLWLKIMKEKIDTVPESCSKILIGDLRFPNEAEFVRSYTNSVVVKITTNNLSTSTTHQSEHPIPNRLIDRTVLNQYDDTFSTYIKDLDREYSKMNIAR